MNHKEPLSRLLPTAALVLGAALLGFAGGWVWQASGIGRGATEQIVRNYILDNPEILPEAMDRMRQRELQARLEPLRGALEGAYPGAVIGAEDGTVTLVEFTDYACPYCRMSTSDVEALTAAMGDLKVVIREYPNLTPQSFDAARMALAAADQGRYVAFHKAMFAKDRPTAATIEAAAREAGIDLAQARADIETGKYEYELENNARLANAIGLSGTPAWVVGNEAYSGAIGRSALAEAIERARGG